MLLVSVLNHNKCKIKLIVLLTKPDMYTWDDTVSLNFFFDTARNKL